MYKRTTGKGFARDQNDQLVCTQSARLFIRAVALLLTHLVQSHVSDSFTIHKCFFLKRINDIKQLDVEKTYKLNPSRLAAVYRVQICTCDTTIAVDATNRFDLIAFSVL